jgi:hypothetical protein
MEEGLSVFVGSGKLTHQEVGIKEEDDECDLDDGAS